MSETELQHIVGSDDVMASPDILESYASNNSFAPPVRPVAVVTPSNVNEVQSVVRWANQTRTPLVPVSSKAPHFRGDTIPAREGAVVVDLSRMNRIIRINPPNRVALVEPGVTFGELQTELAKSGLSAYMPLLPRIGKSVLTSALERDPITMPCVHFDSTDPMLCTQIVFGTGDIMRTGEAAGPDSLEKQWEIGKAQISPFGPTQMDPQRLVSGAQGTMGIVTWMSVKCRFLSDQSRAYFIASETVSPLIELTHKLTKIRFTGNIFIMNGLNGACLSQPSSKEVRAVADKSPPWLLFVSCEGYGPLPEEKVAYLEADLKDFTRALGLEVEVSVGDLAAEQLSRSLSMPSPEPYWKQRAKGGFGELFFLTTLERIPAFTGRLFEIAKMNGFPSENIGVYVQPVVMGTSCHCEFEFYFDPNDARERNLAKKLTMDAADKLEAMGAFFSRPYRPWSDIAYRRHADTVDMQKKVKGIFDPNGVLNPGHLCF